jgi:uncharacterized protein
MDLFGAIEAGNAEEVARILADDPALAASRSPDGVSAVLWARYRGRPDVVEAVLAAGPVLDVFDAAALGRLARLVELVDDDPGEANTWSTDGFSPLGLAAFFDQPDAVRYLIEQGADVAAVARNPMRVQPLHSAAASRSVESARLLLAAGADPDAEQHGGWTPLMAARRHGDQELIALLLAYGASEAGDHPGDPAPQATDDTGNRSSTS